ncbi:MAG: hypothetical protein KJ726_01630 [Verrucomicrobia bacterium]|nr:hypothetical protein [Verrucomicrobiota bacterium]
MYNTVLRYLENGGIKVFPRENERLDSRLLSLYLKKHEPFRRTSGFRGAWNGVRGRLVGRFFKSARAESVELRSFIYSHTEFVELILAILVRRALPQWEKEHVLGRYFDSFAHFQIAHAVIGEGEAILTDPGLIQRGIALLGYGTAETNDQDLHEYMRLTPRPDLVISVQTPPAICLARMQARSFPKRLQDMSEREITESLNKCQTYLQIAKECLRQRGSALIEVENAGTLPLSIEKIRADLERVGLGH